MRKISIALAACLAAAPAFAHPGHDFGMHTHPQELTSSLLSLLMQPPVFLLAFLLTTASLYGLGQVLRAR